MALIFTYFQQEVSPNHLQSLNLWISEASPSKLKKFQHSLVLPNTKYNCTISFWSQLYWLFIYASKYIFPYKNFLIDAHTKIGTEITWYRKKLLKFLHGVLIQFHTDTFSINCHAYGPITWVVTVRVKIEEKGSISFWAMMFLSSFSFNKHEIYAAAFGGHLFMT